jgi:transcriptional regulator with XRE-family HTH domain
MSHWALKVKDRLRERRLSYRAIAAKLGVDPGAVGNWMIGKRTPTVENLTNLAKELGFTLSELMGDDAATSPIEAQVLRTFRDMTPVQQEAALAFLTTITKR